MMLNQNFIWILWHLEAIKSYIKLKRKSRIKNITKQYWHAITFSHSSDLTLKNVYNEKSLNLYQIVINTTFQSYRNIDILQSTNFQVIFLFKHKFIYEQTSLCIIPDLNFWYEFSEFLIKVLTSKCTSYILLYFF